jgi:hypothetical protein
MEKLLLAIQDWSVLAQGVFASAVFSATVFVGRRLFDWMSMHVRNFSKKQQIYYLNNELLRHRALATSDSMQAATYYASMLWYRASRHVITGLIWLSLGLIFNSIVSVFGLVGFFGCACYLFSALNVVRPVVYEGDLSDKIKELESKVSHLEESLNNVIAPKV